VLAHLLSPRLPLLPLPISHVQEVTASRLGALGWDRSMPAPTRSHPLLHMAEHSVVHPWTCKEKILVPLISKQIGHCHGTGEEGKHRARAGSSVQARWVLASAKVGCSCWASRGRKEQCWVESPGELGLAWEEEGSSAGSS